MKNILIGALLAFTVFLTLSYKTTNNQLATGNSREVYNIPLMQKNVIVTTSKDYMLRLIQKSNYILQDVDVVYDDFHSKSIYSYTLIKY